MKKPLEGLFVVEMTSYWAATTTARFLRAMGARVVKIETPPIGDACRYYGRSMGMPITPEENPIHDIFNGGKECIALDLKKKENLQIVYNMLEKADMFVTSTRTSGLKKLGLDWETLHEKYPKLVMGQVIGYGNKGPLVSRPGIDAIAYFGANGVVLDTRTDPDSPPIYPTGGMGDTTTGITLLAGLLAALYVARDTGVGDYVMTSLYGTGNYTTAGFATNCNYGYQWPREAHTMSPMGQGYKCKDGKFIYVFVNEYDKCWPVFAKALGIPEEIATNERFRTKEATTIIENRSELVDIIREYALKKDAQEILDVLVEGDVPSCILNQYKDRFEGEWLEQSLANGYLAPHTYESGKTAYLAQMPIYFESLGVQDYYERHRKLGEDNEAIIKEFGE
jgi:crotonobetainyl-CoA:carnitine CoA-transferase CaiB-like acyl-CoA transferase